MLVSIKDFINDNTRFSNLVRIRIGRHVEAMKDNGKFKGKIEYDKYAMLREHYRSTADRDWTLTYKYIFLIEVYLGERGVDFSLTVHPYGLQLHP